MDKVTRFLQRLSSFRLPPDVKERAMKDTACADVSRAAHHPTRHIEVDINILLTSKNRVFEESRQSLSSHLTSFYVMLEH